MDDAAFAARSRIVHTDQRSAAAESFREAGTKLLSRFGRTPQAVVVTGTQRHSGKTTCASNLALVLAQTGRKVLLVDANEENPSLQRVFPGGSGKPGMSEVMFDQSMLAEALQATSIPALSVLHWSASAGVTDDYNAASLEKLCGELRRRFDWVVFDSGAMQLTLTRRLLAAVGKALCVSGSGEDAQTATAQIELCGAVNLGLVENTYSVLSGVTANG